MILCSLGHTRNRREVSNTPNSLRRRWPKSSLKSSGVTLAANRNTQFRWFARQLRPLFGAHTVSMTLIVLSSLMYLLDPLLIKWLIDRILPKKDFHLLFLAVAGFFGIYVCRLVLSALAGLVSFRTVQSLVFRIRLAILEQMNRLSADYHETTPNGEKLYRMEQDVDQVAELGSSLVPYALQTTFNAVFVVGTMFVLDFKLTCMVLPLVPLFFVFRRHFESRLREASDSAQRQSSQESSFIQEHLASVIQIQLLHQEQNQTQMFLGRATARVKALNHRNLVEILFRTSYMAVITLGTIAILGYGSYQVFAGALTVGGLVASYSYIARLFDPLNAAVEIYSRLNRMSASIRRILEVIEMAPSVDEKPDAVNFILPIRGCVEMKGISFSYRARQPVLQELDLRLEAGEKVALVGISGSGKSTIAKLIARLYDAERGTVYIDRTDVRNVRLESLRTKICYVMQEGILFDRTLKENLLLGRPSATTNELRRVIEIADLEELLRRLPQGWDTPLGPRGNALSGGERQRVALARAVLQRPSLLLLDESTSALDAPSERRIFTSLAHYFSNQTILFISHRISALKWVDRIVVLNQGVVEDQGTHEQLMARSGLYSWLHSAVTPAASAPASYSSTQ
jgi:ABC-type bacteriocin/lantibiotic exporter with double-glycine peptidase domain